MKISWMEKPHFKDQAGLHLIMNGVFDLLAVVPAVMITMLISNMVVPPNAVLP